MKEPRLEIFHNQLEQPKLLSIESSKEPFADHSVLRNQEQETEQRQSEQSAQEILNQLRAKDSLDHLTTAPSRLQQTTSFQQKHIPEYLNNKLKNGNFANKILDFFIGQRVKRTGEELLPKNGPFLVASNHFGGDSLDLLALLKNYDTHIAASQAIHWERSQLASWLLKKSRTLSAPESLEHLSEEEKQELLTRITDHRIRSSYQKVIEREKETKQTRTRERLNFIRSSVALLTRGDVICVYPEGLSLYDGDQGNPRAQVLYPGYPGIEVIARQYHTLTGHDLPIVPIASYKDGETKHMIIQKPLLLSQNTSGLSDTDWCMAHIASKLPETQRGYYAAICRDNALEPDNA